MNISISLLLVLFQSLSFSTEDCRDGGRIEKICEISSTPRAYLSSMPGWPKTLPSHPNYSPTGATMADLNGDGIMEILAGSTLGDFRVWNILGDTVFTKSGLGQIQSKPAIGDIDLDGEMEIVVTNRSNGIYIWDSQGVNHPGWPVYVGEVSGLKSPVLFDLNGDDTLEIIVGERDYPKGKINVFSSDGTLLWSDTLDYMCVATPSVGDIDNDGTLEIVAASYYSLYVWDSNGNLEPNWPLTIAPAGGMSYSQPTLVDLDNDTTLEIAITYYDWNVSDDFLGVWNYDATPYTGWPKTLWGGQSYGTPVPVDVDQDLDIEFSDASSHYMNGPLHLFSSVGVEETGWPFYFAGFLEGTPISFDFDDDNYCELLVANNSTPGEIYVLNYNGTQVSGAPFDAQGAFMVNGATVGDADGDGDTEICLMVTAGTTAYINLFTLDSIPYKGYLAPYFSWFHDRWNTGWFHPAPPESLTLDVPVPLYGLVKVEWHANDEPDILGYHVYRSLTPGGPYERLTTTPWEDTVYFDMTAIEDTINYYAVSAIIRAGTESYLSDEDSIWSVGIAEQDEVSRKPHIMCTTISTGKVHIAFSNLPNNSPQILEVYDVAGRKIKQWRIASSSGSRTLHVHQGVYFIRLNGTQIKKKVVVF
jgi:hypothetical protein